MQGIFHPFVACHCKSLRIPFPRVDDIFEVLEGAKYFSSLDLLSGYWQIKITSYDKPISIRVAWNTAQPNYTWILAWIMHFITPRRLLKV